MDKKANLSHTHSISDITNLQSELDKKSSASHTHTIAGVKNLQDELDKKADKTDVVSKADLQNFGGRNLFLNSNDIKSILVKYDGGNYYLSSDNINEFGKENCLKIKADAGNLKDATKVIIKPKFSEYVKGNTYTFSFYIKNNREYDMFIKVVFLENQKNIKIDKNSTKRVVVTEKFDDTNISIYLNGNTASYYIDCTVGYFKLETGSVVTDWTPAPEDFKIDKSDILTKYDLVTETDKLKNLLDKKANKSDIISKDELNNLNIKIDNFKRTVLWEYNYSKSTFFAGSFGFNYDNYIDLDKKYGDTIFTTSNSNSNITIDKSKVSNFDKSSERLLVINDNDGKYRIVQDILQVEGKMLYRAKVEDELSDSFYVSKLEQLSRLY